MLSAPSGAIGDFAKANLQDYPRTYRTIQDWPIENGLVKRTILAAGSTFSGDSERFHRGPVWRLSAAGPHLHAKGRGNVLTKEPL